MRNIYNALLVCAALCLSWVAMPQAYAKHATATPPTSTMNKEQKTMTPEMLLSMARVGSFALSPDGKKVVFIVKYPHIEANKFTSKIFTIGSDGKNRVDITGSIKSVNDPRWIDNGQAIAFMAKSDDGSMQLFKMTPNGEQITQLSAVEGGITGYLFSPHEDKVLYSKDIKFGETVQDKYPDLPKANARLITDLMYKHWDEWVETIPHPFLATIGNTPFTSGKDLLEGEPYEAPMKPFSDMSDFAFSPDGRYIAYASRKKTGLEYAISTNSDIYLYDTETGKTKNLTVGMMGYDTHPVFSPNGKELAFLSMEHDGYESDLNRIFILDIASGGMHHLNYNFEYNAEHLQWAEDGKSLYFLSCVNALYDIYRIETKLGKITQVTTGINDYTGFDAKNGVIVASRQSLLEPVDLYRIDLSSKRGVALTQENKDTLSQLDRLRLEKRMMKTTNGEQMLVWVIYPPYFDQNKRYPSVLFCQGGPQSPVSQFWSYRWNMRLMAEKGYIVILPNRHGVPGFGKAWNEQISGDYGGQNMQDYMTAADVMKKEPFVDPDKMGCVGASYGGFSVYWLAGHHDNRFACFIAHSGIFNLEAQYLETEEKFFANWDMGGAPWDKDNATAQKTFATSPHKFVQNWKKPILVIHGERDYRILASQGMQAFDAARMRGIPCEMLLFPEENHWILGLQNSLLWHRVFYNWLDKWLK